ncbi:translocation/assembly module TamB domain-containing protein [Gaetbulibacter saemankumensis]|uniref:translocation/assembly module TamB domain-containing protein n=1 Tax=Gaetbulibacter saemankumensis TaxID=311208 RepID=UPI0006869AF0|nr:translocation/assembly module TamB domain-containing protein [Gaetbulibacter saemankumensis]
MLVLSLPIVQTGLGNIATSKLNNEFNTNINIDRLSLQFNGDVELKNIYIEDYKQDTLISIQELNTSIISISNLINGKLTFGDIDIIDLVFNIKTYEGTRDTNLDVFVARFESDNPNTREGQFLMSSSDVSIYDGIFRLIDENRETINLLELNDLNINATNFLINGSDVGMRVNTLSFKDSRGVFLKNLSTNFKYTPADMQFANLKIKTPNSILQGELEFNYNREDLQFFTDKVQVKANFADSSVLLDELNTFYNEFGKGQVANFSVDLSGTLNNLTAKNLQLNTSSNTKINGDIRFENLFNKEEGNFFLDGNFRNLTSTHQDLKDLLPNVLGEALPTSLRRLGAFVIYGNTQITSSTVNADIEINTELGFIDSNLQITKVNDIDNASYQGKIAFEDFDFGIFLDDPIVGVGALNFEVKGSGFTVENIDTQVKGDIFELVFNNYNYRRIKVAGNVRNKIFDGSLIANDRNLKLNFLGLVDFSGDVNKYDFEANVDYAELNTLNFIKNHEVSIFKSNVKMNMNASGFDDAYGKIAFRNTSYKNQIDTYYFNQFDISSKFEDGIRHIAINSPDIIEGELKGRFRFRDLKKLFENSLGEIYTNYVPHEVTSNQSIDFNFKIYNKIIEVIYPEIELGKNTFIRGAVESDAKRFRLTFKSPKIKLLDYFVDNIELQVDNSNPLFNTYVEVDSLKTKYYDVSKFNLINVTLNDTLFMRSEFSGGKQNKDVYNLNLYHTINEEGESVVGFKKSDVTIKNAKWNINTENNKSNKIAFNKALSTFKIDDFIVKNDEEEIRLAGFIKDSTQKDINLDFYNVRLKKITPELEGLTLNGIVNGKLDILQQNGSYLPNSNIVIDDFVVNDFNLGSFDAKIIGNDNLTNYNVDLTIKDDVKKSFLATGDISIARNNSYIDVDLVFDRFNLQPLNPLLQDILSNIRGIATGRVNVKGNLKRPGINGELVLDNGGIGIPYLNVDYDFAPKSSITLKDQSFIFNNVKLSDTKYNSKGDFNGWISHVNFSKWNLDLNVSTQNLLVLDTPESEDALYYGTGFLGGQASIKGPTEQLVISVVGETKPGTVFKIPLNDTESFGDNTYIHFITAEEKRAKNQGKKLLFTELDGLDLEFDLDVTKDAEVEIIIDKNSGHGLKGRGRGGLLVEINTNGKFNMYGDFSVFEGVYNFAYGGLIQKEFIVQPGGTLNWEGDPLQADIKMQAIYKTQANPSPLLDNPINRSIPVELQINLSGKLDQPQPDFEFNFPNVSSTVKSELNYRLESNEDRQNQALYLLSTGAFSRGLSELSFSGTIAERLNGIVNGIFTAGDNKLNIGLNYEVGENRPDYQTGDRFGVTLQTQISDRVLINGKVAVPVGEANATQTVVAGDVEIDFLLNEEGTLTAKVFNRENSIRNFGEDIGYTQGIGISYNVEFDTFQELIRNLFKKSDAKREEQELQVKTQKEAEEALPEYIQMQ